MNIAKAVKASIKSLSLTLRKHQPEIMVVGGCIGAVGAAVLACKATLKSRDVVEAATDEINEIKYDAKGDDTTKEEAAVRIKAAGKIALNYLPSVALGTASILSILGGHSMLKKRHLVTVAALADQADRFDKYKKRVEEKLGIEDATKLLTGEHDETVEETVKDPNTGKEKSRNVTKTLMGEDLSGRFQFVLDRANCYDISNDFDTNIARLQLIEDELNKTLDTQVMYGNARGLLMAKDVLSRIGVKDLDVEWLKNYNNMGVVWTQAHPTRLDLGLKEARRLHQFGIKPDHDEVTLSINFVPNIWDYV